MNIEMKFSKPLKLLRIVMKSNCQKLNCAPFSKKQSIISKILNWGNTLQCEGEGVIMIPMYQMCELWIQRQLTRSWVSIWLIYIQNTGYFKAKIRRWNKHSAVLLYIEHINMILYVAYRVWPLEIVVLNIVGLMNQFFQFYINGYEIWRLLDRIKVKCI